MKQTTLDLNGPILKFLTNPQNISVVTGVAVTFVGIATAIFPTQTPANPASNTGIVTYRWYEDEYGELSDSTTITGSATTTLTINPVKSPVDSGRKFYLSADYVPSAYGVSPIVAGTARSTGNAINEPIFSTTVTLSVISTLSIVSQPIAVTDASSENFTTFNITASVSDALLIGLLSYQWRLNGSNLSNDANTIGSNNSTLQIRRTAGTYTIDCIVSHPNTNPLTITSNSVTYITEIPRELLVVERIDTSGGDNNKRPTLTATEQFDLRTQTVNLVAIAANKNFNYNNFDPQRGNTPPGIDYCIYSPEKDITVQIEIAGASGESRNSVQAGRGGYGVFKITLKKNVEYTFKLGSYNGSFGPTGGTLTGVIEGGVGGGGAFFYRGTRLLLVAGGGGGSGTQAAGGNGSGPGSGRAENGFGRNGGKGGDGGPSNDPNETVDSYLYDMNSAGRSFGAEGSRAMECLLGSPNFTNAGINRCDDYGLSRYKGNVIGLLEAEGSAVITRGFKSGDSGRINGGRARSGAGGGGGGGAKGGNASSGNKCGGGGGSGFCNRGELTLLKSENGVRIGDAYATIKLFSATDSLPNPLIPPPANFVSVDWNNLSAPGYKLGRFRSNDQACAYRNNIDTTNWNIGDPCTGTEGGQASYGHIQIDDGRFRKGSNFNVSSNPGILPFWGPHRGGNESDSIASVSYLEWSFELPDFGPVSYTKDGSNKRPEYDNLARIGDRNGLNLIFYKDAKLDEYNGGGSCGDRARDANEAAEKEVYTCSESEVWRKGFEVGILLQIIVPLDSKILLPDGTQAANQARYQYIQRLYTRTFTSWDMRTTIVMNERFVIPDYYLGCYSTPKLDFIRIEYVDDLTLKDKFPNDLSKYRNVGGIEFDMLPEWNNRNSNERDRKKRESNSIEFGRAVRR
jgi:hypothetical protein